MTSTPLRERGAWKALEAHHEKVRGLHLRQLFADDSSRGTRLTAEAVGIYLDYSKNRLTDETLRLLLALAGECGLRERIEVRMAVLPAIEEPVVLEASPDDAFRLIRADLREVDELENLMKADPGARASREREQPGRGCSVGRVRGRGSGIGMVGQLRLRCGRQGWARRGAARGNHVRRR